jgi:hypothetical protein
MRSPLIALNFRHEHIPFVTQRKHKLRPAEHSAGCAERLTTAGEMRVETEGNSCFRVEEA